MPRPDLERHKVIAHQVHADRGGKGGHHLAALVFRCGIGDGPGIAQHVFKDVRGMGQ